MGAALVLFFVLLLAFAEVIGFTAAYVARLGGDRRASTPPIRRRCSRAGGAPHFIGGLLVGLYAVLYILLSLEAFSLLIGSLLLFVALAGVMYARGGSTGAAGGEGDGLSDWGRGEVG